VIITDVTPVVSAAIAAGSPLEVVHPWAAALIHKDSWFVTKTIVQVLQR
jgi:hypothetical protein